MPVEENTNYVLLSWAYWRRTKDDSRARRHAEAIEKALEFVLRCDSTGNGVPDQGVANTIDDATPAVQYGKEQVYLAVKALTAFLVGAELLESVGRNQRVFAFRAQAEKISRVLQDQAWLGDHFATLVDPSAEGVLDAWTGKPLGVERLPGWDAAHIYTANGLVLLDMMGMRAPVDEERLRTDLRIATRRCLTQYGCRHSDYGPSSSAEARGAQETAYANRIGWMSMNMLRDMAAFYRGVDLTNLSSRYWDFQVLTNTQGPNLFFETFHGNNLCFYPRGVVVFGYFEALAGARIDRVEQKLEVVPLNAEVEVPLVFFADWKTGAVPSVAGGKLQGEVVWT
jgi:hypothetical protein